MIELRHDQLVFQFPEAHRDARLVVEFQRTLRIPDDGGDYPLPAGLGRFPIRHVDDFADNVPESWLAHGGVVFPMYQSEAMWINFSSDYQFAVKVAAGKICAVTGEQYRQGLHRRPQDYVVTPNQPWLDGFCVKKGVIRQFVAMPLGSGYSAEEQITGEAEYGGLQIQAYPILPEYYQEVMHLTCGSPPPAAAMVFAKSRSGYGAMAPDMGLAPGGRMRQEIYKDRRPLEQWDRDRTSRCYVHIANSLVWRAVTGEAPPTAPLTAREYKKAGVPWFDYYAEGESAVEGSGILGKLKSVIQMGKEKQDVPVPENESITPDTVVELRKGLAKGQVREGRF
jgi:hypothetical protein